MSDLRYPTMDQHDFTDAPLRAIYGNGQRQAICDFHHDRKDGTKHGKVGARSVKSKGRIGLVIMGKTILQERMESHCLKFEGAGETIAR